MSTAAIPRPRARATPSPREMVSFVTDNYYVRRVFRALVTIVVVTTITFFIVHLMPGSPVEIFIQTQIATYGISYQDARNMAAALYAVDVSEPIYRQYIDYLGQLLHGNLGHSLLSPGTPVASIMLSYMPWTLFSVGVALLCSFTLGVGLGLLMAYKRESPLDHTLTVLGSVFHSVPNYITAILLVVFLGIQLKLFNVATLRGSYTPGLQVGFNLKFLLDALQHALLPMVTYILTTVGSWMLIMKSSTIAALDEDYVTVARARGLRDRRITTAYVGRNAILPLVTQLAISMGFVIGGSILIESIFVYQGIGYILGNAISQRDYSVMQGIFLVITISVVLANLLAELLYGRIDPRVRIQGEE
jgi:peptide/nickel transport system permease protein